MKKKISYLVVIIFVCIPNLMAQTTCEELYKNYLIKDSGMEPNVAKAIYERAKENSDTDWCKLTGGALSSKIDDQRFIDNGFQKNVSPRSLQNKTAEPSGAGLLNQNGAVPSIVPIATAGGSFATGGTDDGASTIVALTLNPSIFFADISSAEKTAESSRLGDVTIYFPTNAIEENSSDLEYFGIRARFNITGISSGDKLLKSARNTFIRFTQQQNVLAENIGKLLENKTDTEKQACYDQIYNKVEGSNSCYNKIEIPAFSQEQKKELESSLREARLKADSEYFGLDLRFDSGDPTFGNQPGADGTRLFGGLARGRTLSEKNDQNVKYHFRIGVDYFDQEDYQSITTDTVMNMPVMDTTMVLGSTNFSLDSAIGLEFSKLIDNQTISFSTGLELRLAKDIPNGMDKVFQTNYMILRSSLSVPFTETNKISLNLGVPVFGEISPVFSISANWSLLLPD
ncbi:MAG: hypothetical protein JXR11_14210 [Balneola sp.]